MTFSYELTDREFSYFYRQYSRDLSTMYATSLWLMTCVAGVALWSRTGPFLGGIFILAFIAAPVVQWFTPRSLRNKLKDQPGLIGKRQVDADEKSIRISHPTFVLETFWDYFGAFSENAEVFLLFAGDSPSEVFPKSQMSPPDVEALRKLLEQKLPKKKLKP